MIVVCVCSAFRLRYRGAMKAVALSLLLWVPLLAEERTLTLRQAVDLALKQNPEILISRLEEQKAVEGVRIAKDPFTPRIVVGSGLAYSTGYPMSIDGAAPSVLQARALQSIYNKPRSYDVAVARENARATAFDTAGRRDEIAHRTAVYYLLAERASRALEISKQQVASFSKVAEAVQARVQEGRELPVEGKRANLRIAQAKQRVQSLTSDLEEARTALAVVVGLTPEDRIITVAEERGAGGVPVDENEAVESAIGNSKEIKRLQSAVQARTLEVKGARAARMPSFDLVAQYGLFARYNYENYFRTFQRHNGQLGMSFQVPIFAGSGAGARAAQAELEISRLRVEIGSLHNRVTVDTRKLFHDLGRAESSREVAKQDLEVTREQLSVALAQMEEGRATLRQVEELRAQESDKWLAFYDTQHLLERARLDLLRQTGNIIAALQ